MKPSHLIIIVSALVGAACGQWGDIKYRDFKARHEASAYMQSLMAQANKMVISAEIVLARVNISPFKPCSDSDHAYLRKLIFSAHFIKDIGRLSDNRLMCSSLLGAVTNPHRRRIADVQRRDGTFIYGRRELVTPDSFGAVLGKEQANVVLANSTFDLFHSARYAFSIFMTDEYRAHSALLFYYPFNSVAQRTFIPARWRYENKSHALQEFSCDDASGICIHLTLRAGKTTQRDYLIMLLSTCFGMISGGGLGTAWIAYGNRSRSLSSLLKKALFHDELDVVYQPIVTIADGKLTGFEALLRWEIRNNDFVPPDVFIAEAEKAGFVGKITCYVLRRVVDDMGAILRQHRDVSININITAVDLNSDAFLSLLDTELRDADIEPQQIGLELTERTPIACLPVADAIARLRARGHRLYIDDFGTGYSSLSYLGKLHVDAIKIDKSFTRSVRQAAGTVSVMPQIVSMAQEYGLGIVIEGIETKEQVDYFRSICPSDKGQGWFYGKPVSAQTAEGLARRT